MCLVPWVQILKSLLYFDYTYLKYPSTLTFESVCLPLPLPGGRNLDLATISQIAMPFGAEPISSAPYSSPACVRRSPFGVDGKSSSGAQMMPGRSVMMLLTVPLLSFLWSTFC